MVAPVDEGKCEGMVDRPNNPRYQARQPRPGLYAFAERFRRERPRVNGPVRVTTCRRLGETES